MKRTLLASSALAGLLMVLPHTSVHAAGPVWVCDPTNDSHCMKPNADGSINTSGSGSGGNVTITGPLGTGPTSQGVTVTLDATDAANLAGPIPAGTNAIGSVSVSSGNITAAVPAVTSGGETSFHVLSAASNNATLVSTGAHTLYDLEIVGTNTAVADVRIYDSASSPTCSSATGVIRNYPVITTSGLESGVVVPIPPQGIKITNGLAYCITGANADNDNTNAPTGVNVNGGYN
jgi:hypothetical protein